MSTNQMKCPMCAELVSIEARKCRFCGEILDIALKVESQAVRVDSKHVPSANIAALLSIFIPGAGQIYSGRVVTGLMWLFLVIIGYACLILPGLILHIICIFNANNVPK